MGEHGLEVLSDDGPLKIHRSRDPAFLQTLARLRSSMPTRAQLNHICRGRKAWSGDAPCAEDMARLLREYPQATHVAATRRGVAEVNRLALQALYAGAAPVAHLPGMYEDNPDNYVAGRFRADRCPSPAEVPIHTGSRLYLTRNICAQGRRFFERHGLHCPQSQH